MNLNEFTTAIAETEGKKHQTSIGDIREITAIIIKMLKTDKVARKFFFSQVRVTGECVESEVKDRPINIKKKGARK